VLAASIFPINAPAGVGTSHAVQVVLLCAIGVSESEALAVAMGIHAAMLLTVGLQGLAGFAIAGRSRP